MNMAHRSMPVFEIPELDRQHRSILDGLQFLREAPRLRESDVAELHRCLAEIKAHFAWEESELDRVGYPDKIRHKVDHERQVANLEDLLKYVDEGHERLDEDFFQACLAWTERHIRSMDADFVLFLKQRECWDLQQELRAWEYEEHLQSI